MALTTAAAAKPRPAPAPAARGEEGTLAASRLFAAGLPACPVRQRPAPRQPPRSRRARAPAGLPLDPLHGLPALLLLLLLPPWVTICSHASSNSGISSRHSGASFHAHPQQRQQPQPRWRGPRCLGSGGRPVDWWVLLKYPAGQLAAVLDSDSLTPAAPPPLATTTRTPSSGIRARNGDGEGENGGSSGGEGTCLWHTGVDINYPDGPLRRTLAAAAAAAAASTPTADGGDGTTTGNGRSGIAETPPCPQSSSSSSAASASPSSLEEKEEEGSVGYAFYNDADPEGAEHWTFAHAKGLLLFGPSGGVWLSHSFPSFPAHPPRPPAAAAAAAAAAATAAEVAAPASNSAGTDGDGLVDGLTAVTAAAAPPAAVPWDAVRHAQTVYGQHALCLTLPREHLLRVAESLLVAQAYVYDHVMPHDLGDQYDAIQALIDASEAERAEEGPAATAAVLSASASAAPIAQIGASSSHGASYGGGGGGGGSRWLMSGSGHSLAAPLPPPPPPPPRRNVSRYSLTSLGGSTWLHVAKSPILTVPFQEEVLEPLLGADMAWETWRIGRSYDSKCPPDTLYSTLNVRRIALRTCSADNGNGGGNVSGGGGRGGNGGGGEVIEWDSLKDHSKWGISMAGLMAEEIAAEEIITSENGRGMMSLYGILQNIYVSQHDGGRDGLIEDGFGGGCDKPAGGGYVDGYVRYTNRHGCGARRGHDRAAAAAAAAKHVCLGDLNRQPSQRLRGGGYVCSADPRVWAAFRSIVAELEPCPASTSATASAAAAPAAAKP